METVVNGNKINNFYISGNKINGFAKNGEIVFKKELSGLIVTISREPDVITPDTVTVTITANKTITIQNGGTWLKVNDYTYKKVYPSNTTQTVLVVAEDGESKEVTIVVDNIDKPPTITVKTGKDETVGDIETKMFSKVSFKLYDDVGLKEYELNGVVGKISVSQWGDLNNVTTSFKGTVLGLNTLLVRDTAGNETTYEFTLIEG